MAAWLLHRLCCGEEAGARNRAFFRVKWLQPAMKATSSVRRLRLGSFGSFYVVVLCVSWRCGARSHWNGCMMLHGLCCGEEAGARNLVFFRVKWLQPAMKATASVRRLRLGSFGSFYVFCNNACSCVGSSMRFLKLWCQSALEWLHDVAWALGARNRVFFRVKWLQPAMKATSSVRRLRLGSFGSFYVFCNNDRIVMAAWMLLGAAQYYCLLQLDLVNRIGVAASRLR